MYPSIFFFFLRNCFWSLYISTYKIPIHTFWLPYNIILHKYNIIYLPVLLYIDVWNLSLSCFIFFFVFLLSHFSMFLLINYAEMSLRYNSTSRVAGSNGMHLLFSSHSSKQWHLLISLLSVCGLHYSTFSQHLVLLGILFSANW